MAKIIRQGQGNSVQFRSQRQEEDIINLTPLIDVVFLLLIFFMVTTTFTEETHLTLDLPQATGEVNPAKKSQQIEIVINSKGKYAINGLTLLDSQAKTLSRGLSDLAKGNFELPLIISADADATHQSVVLAMDVAGQLGFSHLSLTTRRVDGEK